MSDTSTQSASTPYKRRTSAGQKTVAAPGMNMSLQQAHLKQITESAFERRRLLTVPREIAEANPDKRFYYVNLNRLEKNGFWHERGYELFKASELPDNLVNKFNKSPDGYIHRGEMALAWLPEEEARQREIEDEVIKGNRDLTALLTRQAELKNMEVFAKNDKQEVSLTEEKQNG